MNKIEDDGDIIKGLGYMTLYAAYVEGKIDELLVQLSALEEFTDKERRWPISRKINKLEEILKDIQHKKFSFIDELLEILQQCKVDFEWRNELAHGRILSPEYHKENLKSGRQEVPDRAIDSSEIYTLVNNLADLRSALFQPRIFDIPNMLRDLGEGRN